MRRYKDLLRNNVDQGHSLDFWDALPVAQEVMRLIDEGDAFAAADLLKWSQCEFSEINDCLVQLLVDRLGPKPLGRKIKNTPELLLEIYDFYRLETNGTEEERLSQLAAKYRSAISTVEDLRDDGRALGRRLAEDCQAEWDEAEALMQETESGEPWDVNRKPSLG